MTATKRTGEKFWIGYGKDCGDGFSSIYLSYTHQVEVNKYAQFFVYQSDLNKVV